MRFHCMNKAAGDPVPEPFYPRDPAKALVEIKEDLYAELAMADELLAAAKTISVRFACRQRVAGLRFILDKMERSL